MGGSTAPQNSPIGGHDHSLAGASAPAALHDASRKIAGPPLEAAALAGLALKSLIRPAKTGSPEIPASGLIQSLGAFNGLVANLAELVRSINALPEPNPNRDSKVGQALLPIIIRTWSIEKPTGNSAVLYDLYLRTHLNPQNQRPQLVFPNWFSGLQSYLSVAPSNAELPDKTVYLGQSPSLASKAAEIQARLSEKREALAKVEERDAASKRPGAYVDVLAGLRSAVAEVEAELPPLFASLKDVQPEAMPEVVGAVGLKVQVSHDLLRAFCKSANEIEELLLTILAPEGKSSPKARILSLPCLGENGKIEHDQIKFETADLVGLGKSPEALAQLVSTYVGLRGFLRVVVREFGQFPKLCSEQGALEQALHSPLFSAGERGANAFMNLQRMKSDDTRRSAFGLLNDPVLLQNSGREPSYGSSLETIRALGPVLWAAKNYLATTKSDNESSWYACLAKSPGISQHLLPLLVEVKKLRAAELYGDLARLITRVIEESSIAPGYFSRIAPIVLLTLLGEEKDDRRRLKNQIPNIEALQQVSDKFGKTAGALGIEIKEQVSSITKAFSISMEDYCADPSLVELAEFIEDYKLFIANPKCMEGLSGNEGMRSGVLIAGDYGVGKTHLVDCLANELGVTCYKITVDKADVSSKKPMIDACRETIAKAKADAEAGRPCILCIDEAESVMANRDLATTSAEQAQLTNYLLQEINNIRKKYPLILIIAATNYPERIDPGMYRDGRFDIQVVMDRPSPEVRRALISNALNTERIPLDEGRINELIAVSDYMLPVTIRQTIFEYTRLGPLRAEKKGETFEFSFEELGKRFRAAQVRGSKTLAERLAETKAARSRKNGVSTPSSAPTSPP